ncbi:MAG: TolB-like 6-bladed beta-propeller domain-containing protein [Bacteroidales bacterium]|jgi:hypothetical protein|nr:TolB-like 6-bladed beta-propeller domain-containing protein [Bacteroidales bacterium]
MKLAHLENYQNDLFIGTGGYMIATTDHIIGIDHGGGETFFYKQSIHTPDSIYRFGRKGQGPNDFIHPFSLQYVSDSLICSYDVRLKRFFEILLNPDTLPTVKSLSFDSILHFLIFKTACRQYVGMGIYPDAMFTLLDSSGVQIKSFAEYPYKDATERNIDNRIRAMAYQGRFGTNLSCTKFVYAASSADIIYFYDIEENDIRLIKKIENRFAEYVPNQQGTAISAPFKSTNMRGYVDLYATDQYVYLLYSGRTYSKYKEKMFEANQLRIYDWSGNLRKEMELDISCKFLCVSPDDSLMWAIAEIPDPQIIRFDLKSVN